MLYEGIKTFILSSLGSPTIDIELTDEQLSICYQRSISKYLYYRNTDMGIYKFYTGQKELLTEEAENTGEEDTQRHNGYEIPRPVLDNMFAVVISSLVPLTGFTGLGDGTYYFSLLMNSIYRNKRSKETYLTDYSLTLNFENTINKILGTNITYEILDDKLYLYPAPNDSKIEVGVKYMTPPSQAELENNNWIKKYALGHAKVMLGVIRRKYGNIPNGTMQIQTDGDALVSEGKQEIDSAFEELKTLAQPPEPQIF